MISRSILNGYLNSIPVEIIRDNTACVCGDTASAVYDIRHATDQEFGCYLFAEGQ